MRRIKARANARDAGRIHKLPRGRSVADRQAHTLEAAGSNPALASILRPASLAGRPAEAGSASHPRRTRFGRASFAHRTPTRRGWQTGIPRGFLAVSPGPGNARAWSVTARVTGQAIDRKRQLAGSNGVTLVTLFSSHVRVGARTGRRAGARAREDMCVTSVTPLLMFNQIDKSVAYQVTQPVTLGPGSVTALIPLADLGRVHRQAIKNGAYIAGEAA